MEELHEISLKIKEKAKSLGFDACGIVQAEFLKEHHDYLANWLDSGFHGEMHYMENYLNKRTNPSQILEKGVSAIVLLKSYNYKKENEVQFKISKYAQGVDYHYLMKERMNQLLKFIVSQKENIVGRCFIDSAPVLERALANKAGLGWFGKNSMLLNKKLGSYFFIGEIIIDKELEYDDPFQKDYCGECTMCIDSCPTKAIISPKVVDARKCISYLTIEYRNEFDEEEIKKLNGWIFGCDICQEVCPWNRKAIISNEKAFAKNEEILHLTKAEWFKMTPSTFKKLFSDSPIKRAGLKQIQRNILAND